MLRSDFAFELPDELIASYPSAERSACRMLCLDGQNGAIRDRRFFELENLLRPGDLLVVNDTRVMKARLRAVKETGGACEVLVERVIPPDGALCHIRATKAPRIGMHLKVSDGSELTVTKRLGDLFEVKLSGEQTFFDLMQRAGSVPLPPYIRRKAEPQDEIRYQTVYSSVPGAVAAPTAGLHFDTAQIESLKSRGVKVAVITLHVGAGTFQPVRENDITAHRMHSEWLSLGSETAAAVNDARRCGSRVVAVGTTAVRALETSAAVAAAKGSADCVVPYEGDTDIFIYPGQPIRAVDVLITNFHLPESTLIMLVCAFAGYSKVMAAYRHAVEERYAFFSYGDCMFITKDPRAQEDLPPSARDTAAGVSSVPKESS